MSSSLDEPDRSEFALFLGTAPAGLLSDAEMEVVLEKLSTYGQQD